MSPITEITWVPLTADATNSEAAATLLKLAPEMNARPGLEGSWQGSSIERPQSAEVINVWSTEEAYKASRSSPMYEKLTELTKSLIDTTDLAVQAFHNTVILHKPVETLIDAPVVQITHIFLPANVDKAAFDAVWEELVSHMRANPPDGFIAGAHGWGLEEVNGAKVFTALSGWESVEKNTAGQEAAADKFAGLYKFSDIFDVHHTSFQNMKAE